VSTELTCETQGQPPSARTIERIIMDEGGQGLRSVGGIVQGELMRRSPTRTGHFRRQWSHQVVRRGPRVLVLTVGNPVFYGPFLDRGTGLYGPRNRWIVPKTAKALRFPAGGGMGFAGPGFTLAGRVRSGSAGGAARWQYAARVRGIRPRHFVRDSLFVSGPRVAIAMKAHAIEAARRIESAGS
jgi:hypothetical protein